jgi:thiol-disulfide isomerase/thioredoxin
MPLVHTLLVAMALSAGDQVVLLDFYADWCGPCRAMQPAVEALVREGYPIRKINVDREPALAAQYGVKGIPCYIMVVNGREVDRVVGGTTYSRLQRMCKTAMAQAAASSIPANAPPPSAGALQNASLGTARAPANQVGGSPPASATGREIQSAATPMPGIAGSGTLQALPFRAVVEDRSGRPTEADDVLLQATVRIRVQDPQGESRGSGTIVDARGGAALILTCGHIFRESRGNGRIEVDLFGPTGVESISGVCLGYDEQRDLGLVMIRPSGQVRTVRIAPAGYRVGQGEPVITAGCSHGQPPTLIPSRITSVDRYNGPPNFQVAGQPVQGRSGGGLFTRDGLLIGVCNAADPQDREGFFAALGSIHAMLDAHNLAFVYQGKDSAAVAQSTPSADGSRDETRQPARTGGRSEVFAECSGRSDGAGSMGEQAIGQPYRPGSTGPRLPGDPPFRLASVSSGGTLLGALGGAAGAGQGNADSHGTAQPSGAELAALGAVRSALSEGGEVILIVRSRRDPQARSQVITIDNPSPEFLRQLASEASTPPPGRELTSLQVRP